VLLQELEVVTDGLATHLMKNCNLNAGDRLVLVFFPGLLFSISLVACFKAGLIAVPVFPPDPRRLKKDLDHFVSIQSNCQAKVVLTHSPYNYAKKLSGIKSIFSSGSATWPDMTWISVDDIVSREKIKAGKMKIGSSTGFTRNLGDIAFLQYTSGSTSEPKGVMIAHSNLAHNLKIITAELKVNPSTINVSWLPQYHDMGLIGTVLAVSKDVAVSLFVIVGSYLGCAYCGGSGIYISPISFLKDPNMWLETISKYKGTHTQAPNFAYALAVRKFKEVESSNRKKPLDLSSLQHMINAAEPVDAEAICDFYATFKPYGLPANVVVPTFGLAEHTVFVCSAGATLLSLDKAALESEGNVVVLGESSLGAIPAENSRPGMCPAFHV
jgi:acyl-CoA synthetase (AMP-forming)/AMP-acid ligase II